ncbi:uncharacterized protein LOC108443868 isoform X12 [Pygocentrus nattereri]|uniref:uncharacterized protein LOC108443868 isoform X12 n=1 Tax=Pygocentrus nattereri TaxID=42514 RepID=UPI0018918D41|nr:uncharacterized protein LOC108443868 isoform X12 [Pygocentrus nattereri]
MQRKSTGFLRWVTLVLLTTITNRSAADLNVSTITSTPSTTMTPTSTELTSTPNVSTITSTPSTTMAPTSTELTSTPNVSTITSTSSTTMATTSTELTSTPNVSTITSPPSTTMAPTSNELTSTPNVRTIMFIPSTTMATTSTELTSTPNVSTITSTPSTTMAPTSNELTSTPNVRTIMFIPSTTMATTSTELTSTPNVSTITSPPSTTMAPTSNELTSTPNVRTIMFIPSTTMATTSTELTSTPNVSNITSISTITVTATSTELTSTPSPFKDPCNNYTPLDQPWRATNATGLKICDRFFNWNGWYRLLYYGMSVRMPESCVNQSRCGTDVALWLNGSHPQTGDGIVTRGVCGRSGSDCCYYTFTPIRVKACLGNYYVYEFVKPNVCNAAYCADTTNNITSDPCNVNTLLDNDWRRPVTLFYTNYSGFDDTLIQWSGWYRLYLQGKSAQIPESDWCWSFMSCGGYTALLLGGSHPRPQDGIVTREIYGTYVYSNDSRQCNSYRSNPIQVKACPGNYYVYRLVKPAASIPMPTYCAVAIETPSYDPCNNYTFLDQPWRAINETGGSNCDRNLHWNGWYRLLYYGTSVGIPDSCVNQSGCGTDVALWLNDSHPQIKDGIVTRAVCGRSGSDCCYYKSSPIRVKACPKNYYVYEFVRPFMCNAAYCAVNFKDPCNNYTALDQPWRATNVTGLWISDSFFNWNGWYRLLYYGMSVRMPESCVNQSRCGTDVALWLNGSHPQIEDGIVTRGVCGSSAGDCCDYRSTPVRVKACPGNYYVYEFVKPNLLGAAYCADVNTIQTNATSVAASQMNTADTANNMTYDPCSIFSVLDNDWRRPVSDFYTNYSYFDDTLVEWSGWYRLYLQGKSAQIPESDQCWSWRMFCGGYTALLLGGSHPQPQDGIVTREIFGTYFSSFHSSQCNSYRSKPIQVKACLGNYYVYRLVKPPVSLPIPTYCAAVFIDPCNDYTVLDQAWRATNVTGLWICDRNSNWTGWYRLLYNGMSIRMPESCVNRSRCGTDVALWLNGSHPKTEDGIVTRGICGRSGSDCCYYNSIPIQVKACPGNYYIYKFVRPTFCTAAYCADVNTITLNTNQTFVFIDRPSNTGTNYLIILYVAVGIAFCGIAAFLAVHFWRRYRRNEVNDENVEEEIYNDAFSPSIYESLPT